jgi:DNA-binding transcriptional LysR family regulator
MLMNITHLKYFYDSVKQGSLQRAAQINFVTPGAISQGILKLEQSFNVELIHHSKNRFEITDHGRLLFESSGEIFSSIQSLMTKMEDAKDPFRGDLNFGTQQSIASTILPSIISDFRKKHPLVRINFNMGHAIVMKEMMETREFLFTITLDHFLYKDHHKIELFEGNFVFVSSEKAQKNFLITSYSTEIYKLDVLYKKLNGKELPVHMRIDGWSVIKKMALAGEGIGFVPDFILSKEERRFIVKGAHLPKIKYNIYCVYPKRQQLNEKSQAFLETFKGLIK